MLIDLHTHSNRSDGTMTPTELVEHAAAVGVDVLGLTDHDTAEGWSEAAAVASRVGIRLVCGMEVSCRYEGAGVHLLAYLPDPTYPPLAEELDRILDGRNSRLPALLQRLRDTGIAIDVSDVRRVAGDAVATGRPHVADALVALGVVRDRNEAFDRYLGPGGPAYVRRYAADLPAMLALVREAGGVSVVAHPWSSRYRVRPDLAGFEVLRELGLAGIEVDHQDHTPEVRRELREIAQELDMVVTGSSDFHGSGKTGHDLACNTTEPDQLDRLLELAVASARAAGRTTPQVVGR